MRRLFKSRQPLGWSRRRGELVAKLLCAAQFAAVSSGVMAGAPINLADIALDSDPRGFVMRGFGGGTGSAVVLSTAGDVNGDGLDDLLNGVGRADPLGRLDAGEVLVVFGKTDGQSIDLLDVEAGLGGFPVWGRESSDVVPSRLSRFGDLDGDGFDDIVIGASYFLIPGVVRPGEAYLVFGKDSTSPIDLRDVADGVGGFSFQGVETFDFVGSGVSNAGDVNGDGILDLFVGAPGAGVYSPDPQAYTGTGEAYILFGKLNTERIQLENVLNGTEGFAYLGPSEDDFVGGRVASGGDINGDGIPDMVMANAPGSPGGVNRAGEAFVAFGGALDSPVSLLDWYSSDSGFMIIGIDEGDYTGAAVDSDGDVNGDGLADIVVSAIYAEDGTPPPERDSGEVYVIFGKKNAENVRLDTLFSESAGGFVIRGTEQGGLGGLEALHAPDVNGDGLGDVVMSTPFLTGGAPGSGKVYVIFGKTDSMIVELDTIEMGVGGFVILGADAGDETGRSLAAGDINGDGLTDLIMGSTRGSLPEYSLRGESFVVFSQEVPPLSATYRKYTRIGDGPGPGKIIATEFREAGRAFIDFSDDDFGANSMGGASLEIVEIIRDNSGIMNFEAGIDPADIANIVWRVETDRVDWDSARVTFKYTDAEIAGVAAPEAALSIYSSPALEGPWQRRSTINEPRRNRVSTVVESLDAGGTFFAVARFVPEADWSGVVAE